MTIIEVLILLLIAVIAGTIGQAITGYSASGYMISIVFGFIGSLIGSWLARLFGLPDLFTITVKGETFPVIWNSIGAVVFVVIIRLLADPARLNYK